MSYVSFNLLGHNSDSAQARDYSGRDSCDADARSVEFCTRDSTEFCRRPTNLQRLVRASSPGHNRRMPPDFPKGRGAENCPLAARASIAPLPPRVGMSVTAVAPQSKAKSIERCAQRTASSACRNGGCTRTNTRKSISLRSARKSRPLKIGPALHAFIELRQNVRGVPFPRPWQFLKWHFKRSRKRRQWSPTRAG